jgi:predicted transglutaminase-like cysteine proteinase
VLEKRRLLLAAGLPVSNLLITVVRKPDGEGHAVLTVRTDAGDFILDNLSDEVKPWDRTGYRYLKRQASTNTGRWVSIRGGESTAVGAVE